MDNNTESTAHKEESYDGPNLISYCTMEDSKKLKQAEIDLFDLKNKRLQHIKNKEIVELGKSLIELKKTVKTPE